MTSDVELRREPGIRVVSSFYRSFGGEDLVVRPANVDEPAFKIEVLLNSDGKAVFPPKAPVREGDLVEREDPRGGVIEYTIDRYEFSKDPFGGRNDHWDAYLIEKRHVSRQFAEPHIVVHGGVNQFAVGDGNALHLTNQVAMFPAVVDALESIRASMPRDALTPVQIEEIEDAVEDAMNRAQEADKPGAVKRALHGLNGVVGEIAGSAKDGVASGVKVWVAATTALILKHIAGL